MSLKNLFKYKLPIKFSFYIGNTPTNELEDGCDFGYLFECDRMHDPKKLSVSKPIDIYEKLKPFFKYLVSKIKCEVQFPYRIVLDVLYTGYQSYRMVHFELNEFFMNDGILVLQDVSNIFKQPFRLQVYAHCYCPPALRVREGILLESEADTDVYSEPESESESEVEVEESEEESPDPRDTSITPVLPLQDHFKTDQCVICMEKEPCILFTPCRHICVCISCDALKPSYKCSCCRARIFQKIKI